MPTHRNNSAAVGPWETESPVARPSALLGADDAIAAVTRLVGVPVIDPSAPPRNADPDRAWREARIVKVTDARCRRCGADLLGGVLPYVAGGMNQPCGLCGTTTYVPLQDEPDTA